MLYNFYSTLIYTYIIHLTLTLLRQSTSLHNKSCMAVLAMAHRQKSLSQYGSSFFTIDVHVLSLFAQCTRGKCTTSYTVYTDIIQC